MQPDSQGVTKLLKQWRDGDSRALDELVPIIYNELRRLAGRCLYSERPGHTLRATALVHEAYLRLSDAEVDWQDRAHFYAIAARVMRRILVEYARAHTRHKRGSGCVPIPLDEAVLVGPQAAAIVEDLDEALQRLAAIDARKSEIVQLLFFGGLTYEETAAALDLSIPAVKSRLLRARLQLREKLTRFFKRKGDDVLAYL